MNDRMRASRTELGWSQAELADRAGVTRQLVGSVEAGRHQPNVAAALSLARALGLSVEELFMARATSVERAIAEAPSTGLVSTARVGDRVVAVPLGHLVRSERWSSADAVVTGDDVEWFTDGRTDGLVLAGCDPALGLLAELAERASGRRMLVAPSSTAKALDALDRATVHGVVVHAGADGLPEPPVPVDRWRFASWQVGLATVGPHRESSLEALVGTGSRLARRDSGASSQHSLVRALRAVGIDELAPGPVAEGHLDAARRVAVGQADVALTMEAAAVDQGLSFAPLETHQVELWIDRRWTDHPGVGSLLDTLASEPFRRRLDRLAGYELAGLGTRVA